jgi:hypothetical protein
MSEVSDGRAATRRGLEPLIRLQGPRLSSQNICHHSWREGDSRSGAYQAMNVLEPNALPNRLARRAEIGQRWKACYRRGKRNEGEKAGQRHECKNTRTARSDLMLRSRQRE